MELCGGRQIGLGLVSDMGVEAAPIDAATPGRVRPPRHFAASKGEVAAHAAFMVGVKDPLWGAGASG